MREGFGQGEGADYKPYIKSREFNSQGTAVTLRDYKTGRNVELLSQGEAMYWHILRFKKDVLDIREQLPLSLDDTNRLAEEMGIKPSRNGKVPMTTDFFVVYTDRHVEAFAFKPSKRSLEKDRTVELLTLEKTYWESKNVPWNLVFKTEINQSLATNIRMCTYFWDEASVFDPMSCMKHMIAHRQLIVDMESEKLECNKLLKLNYIAVFDKWNSIQDKRNTGNGGL